MRVCVRACVCVCVCVCVCARARVFLWSFGTVLSIPFSQWFPAHRGFVAGAVFLGFGLGSVIFNQIITVFVNPDNLSPDLAGEDGET